MRKQARRLWLGDWQRGGEEETDTVTILPVDDEAGEPPAQAAAEQRRKVPRGTLGVAAAVVLFVLALTLLSRGGDEQLPSADSQAPPAQTQQQPQVPQSQVPQGGAPQGFGGPDLTGPGAVKAARAALAKFPGNIERVTAGPGGGGYVVHVFRPDGCEVHVIVGDKFKVLGSDAGAGGGCGGSVPPGQFAPQGGSNNQS